MSTIMTRIPTTPGQWYANICFLETFREKIVFHMKLGYVRNYFTTLLKAPPETKKKV